jgi:1,4-dihydroxy-2-naphthoyl-CoA hydrolase
VNLEEINELAKDSMVGQLGITIKSIGAASVVATMPVTKASAQPFGLLHGGASATFAETLASVGSLASLKEGYIVSGVELNISHLSSAKIGDLVHGDAKMVKQGKSLHVWQVEITVANKPVATSRCTVMVRKNEN